MKIKKPKEGTWDKIKEKESVNNFSDTISEQFFRQ